MGTNGRAGMSPMPRDGAYVLSDVRRTDAVDRLRAVRWRGTYTVERSERHGDAKLTRSAADARQLPEGEPGQHPRSLQGGGRAAVAVNGWRPRRTRRRRRASSWRFSFEGDAADAIDAGDATTPNKAETEFGLPIEGEGLSDRDAPPRSVRPSHTANSMNVFLPR